MREHDLRIARDAAALWAEPAPVWLTMCWLLVFLVAFSALAVNLFQLG